MWARLSFIRSSHIYMSLSWFQILFYSLWYSLTLTYTVCLFLIRSSPYFSFSWRNLFSTEQWYVLSCPNNLQKNFHGRFLAAVLAYKCQHVGVFCVRSCCFCLSVHGLWVFCSFSSRKLFLLLLGPWMPQGETEGRGITKFLCVCIRDWYAGTSPD